MEWLESRAVRPRQARYQAALRPDMKCTIDSKALSNFTATPIRRVCLDCAKIVPNTFTGPSLCQNPTPFHWPESSRIDRAQVIDPEVRNSCAFSVFRHVVLRFLW